MSRVERFEELIAWQKARELTRTIYQTTRQGSFSHDRGLAGQVQRAAVSVMSNIAEDFERGTSADFHHFLLIAKGSCAEVRSQLYVALDVGYLAPAQFEELARQAEEVSRVIGGLAASIARRKSSKH